MRPARTLDWAWAALAGLFLLLLVLNLFAGLWYLVADHRLAAPIGAILPALFCWWVGMGAWRRTVWSKHSSD